MGLIVLAGNAFLFALGWELLTALLGIAHATVRTRLTGVISYSSVENAGLILTGYGGRRVIVSELGTDDLERLRGIVRRMPWSGTALAVGALTMAGLPPTVLFVSEWFALGHRHCRGLAPGRRRRRRWPARGA